MDTDSTSAKSPPENSLALDLQGLTVEDTQSSADLVPLESPDHVSKDPLPTVSEDPVNQLTDENGDSTAKKLEKKKPYVNTDRYLTGSNPRDKPSDEELADRMTRIREQNEKIKQRRLDVQADVDAFKKTQEDERAKTVRTRKLQAGVDQAREQNARRKMDKIQAREWDSGKKGSDWVANSKGEGSQDDNSEPDGQWQRGTGRGSGPRGRGRGRARGRGRGHGRGAAASAGVAGESEAGQVDDTAGSEKDVPEPDKNSWGADEPSWTMDKATW